MTVLVGKPAPDFNVAAVLGNGEIVDSYSFSAATKANMRWYFSIRWTSPLSALPN